jgi:hypothetical protein
MITIIENLLQTPQLFNISPASFFNSTLYGRASIGPQIIGMDTTFTLQRFLHDEHQDNDWQRLLIQFLH